MSYFASQLHKAASVPGNVIGRTFMSGAPLAIGATSAVLGMGFAHLTHDPTKNSYASHMGQESLKVGADAAFEAGLFGGAAAMSKIGTMAGMGKLGTIGMLGAIGISIASHVTGTNPGAIMGEMMEDAQTRYRKETGQGPKPITQNERTMGRTRQAMSLLGGAKRHSMLGSEAQWMHN